MLKELNLALKNRLVRRLQQELDKVELTFKRADVVNQSMLGYIKSDRVFPKCGKCPVLPFS